jgi:hypothetical protein
MSYVPPPPGYAVPAPAAPLPPRPSTVSAAVGLLYLLALLQIVAALISIPMYGAMRAVYTDLYKGTPLEGSEGTLVGAGIAVAVVQTLIIVAGAIVLAILDAKGKQPARIITWIFAGIGICCYGGTLGGNAISGALSGMGSTGSGPDPAEVQQKLADAMPSWYTAASLTIAVVQLLVAIAVIVLLALPPSNAFFRKPEPVWTPPSYPTV